MKCIIKFCTLFLLLALALPSMASTGNVITPSKENVTEVMNNYNVTNQNNSLQLACEIGQYVSTQYGWNCDIRQLNFTKPAPIYINVFYPAADNKKGYEAYYGWFGPQRKEVRDFYKKDEISNNNVMYYRDWGSEKNNWCGIQGVCSWGIVKSYWGNVTTHEENITTNESTQPVVVVISNESHDTERVVMVDSDNSSVQTNELKNNTIENKVENSTNTVNNQGIVDTIEQYWFDFKNANLNNVTFNFFGGN